MRKRMLEVKAELTRRDWKYRTLAARLRERGFDADGGDIVRLVAGRWNPPEEMRLAISDILNRPTFELFAPGGKS